MQLHGSYSSLGRDFKNLFEDLLKLVNAQKADADSLRQQLHAATELALQSSTAASTRLEEVLHEERQQAAADRQNLLSQIAGLITTHGEVQDQRLGAKIATVQKDISSSKESFKASWTQYSHGMDAWIEDEGKLGEEVLRSRETFKSKLKEDWVVGLSTHEVT